MSELIVYLGVVSITTYTAATSLKAMYNPLNDSANKVVSIFNLARSKAISETSAYKVTPTTDTKIEVYKGTKCTTATTKVNSLTTNLDRNVRLQATNWSICFNSRGFADTSTNVVVTSPRDGDRTVEIYIGGSIKLLKAT